MISAMRIASAMIPRITKAFKRKLMIASNTSFKGGKASQVQTGRRDACFRISDHTAILARGIFVVSDVQIEHLIPLPRRRFSEIAAEDVNSRHRNALWHAWLEIFYRWREHVNVGQRFSAQGRVGHGDTHPLKRWRSRGQARENTVGDWRVIAFPGCPFGRDVRLPFQIFGFGSRRDCQCGKRLPKIAPLLVPQPPELTKPSAARRGASSCVSSLRPASVLGSYLPDPNTMSRPAVYASAPDGPAPIPLLVRRRGFAPG